MFLIDSLYINNSGGFQLLDYLVRELTQKNKAFYLLADDRCRGRLDYCQSVEYMPASLDLRKRFFEQHKDDFTSVLCFGNIPAPIKLDVPVYTYFHNVNLLTLKEARSVKEKIKMWLKREVFRHYKRNTDYWVVQTDNTAAELIRHLQENTERVKIMPFFELSDSLKNIKHMQHGEDYVYISNYTGAKGHEELLEAWDLLKRRGIEKPLHLTIREKVPIIEKIKLLQTQGVKIINHGLIPFKEVVDLYGQSKAIIYPSHNESLGLGLIEAITAGCDVIGSDLPFIHTVCKPSEVFNPYSANSIADAVERYEKGKSVKSELLTKNMIQEFIELIEA